MMTEEKAKEQLQNLISDIPTEYIPAMETAIKALDYKIPRKIESKKNAWGTQHSGICPRCKSEQTTTWFYCGSSCCQFCGQRLDWSYLNE